MALFLSVYTCQQSSCGSSRSGSLCCRVPVCQASSRLVMCAASLCVVAEKAYHRTENDLGDDLAGGDFACRVSDDNFGFSISTRTPAPGQTSGSNLALWMTHARPSRVLDESQLQFRRMQCRRHTERAEASVQCNSETEKP